jgi:hypothetical protein
MSGWELYLSIAITLTMLALLLMVGGGLILFLDWCVRKKYWVDSTKSRGYTRTLNERKGVEVKQKTQ